MIVQTIFRHKVLVQLVVLLFDWCHMLILTLLERAVDVFDVIRKKREKNNEIGKEKVMLLMLMLFAVIIVIW